MKNSLTDKQQQIYNIIEEFIEINGYSPTIREICKLSRNNSPATVYVHLTKIKEKGYINYVQGKSRTIVLLKQKQVENIEE